MRPEGEREETGDTETGEKREIRKRGEKREQDAPTVDFSETPEAPEASRAYADLAKSALHMPIEQFLRPRFVNQVEERFDIAQ